MGAENLKMMKEQIVNCVQGQLGDISKVDTHELGQAIDMIKDLAEAIYYCTVTESMEKIEDKEQQSSVRSINYYTTNKYNDDMYRNMERNGGYMYYPGGNGQSGSGNNGHMSGISYYTEMPYEMMRDPREGRSPMRRRMYMEGKEIHKDTNSQLRELEAYLQELSSDITQMIKDASPEERQTLKNKMTILTDKITV